MRDVTSRDQRPPRETHRKFGISFTLLSFSRSRVDESSRNVCERHWRKGFWSGSNYKVTSGFSSFKPVSSRKRINNTYRWAFRGQNQGQDAIWRFWKKQDWFPCCTDDLGASESVLKVAYFHRLYTHLSAWVRIPLGAESFWLIFLTGQVCSYESEIGLTLPYDIDLFSFICWPYTIISHILTLALSEK